MLTRKHSIEDRRPFANSSEIFSTITVDTAVKLAMVAGDITLLLDDTGVILDGSAHDGDFPGLSEWIGQVWLDTVTVESRPKLMEMLAAARRGQVQHWRQINHVSRDGEIPVRYVLLSLGEGRGSIALGRDLRDAAVLQQRLLQAQQSLERDYLRLRQLEARYRLLFDLSAEPVLVIDGETHRIREANPAAHRVLGARPGTLAGSKLPTLFARAAREPLIAFLGAVVASKTVSPIVLAPAKGSDQITLSGSAVRQPGGQFILLRIATEAPDFGAEARPTLEIVERMPDAFVVTDEQLRLESCNLAFVELVGAASADQLRGRSLAEFVGQQGIDLELIEGQIAKHGVARNVSTVVGMSEGEGGEPVELSAVRSGDEEPRFGFVIRAIGRRLRELPPTGQDLPRSVEQLTELVGRMSLKDIVRESTDLIERLCIEAALSYTLDNRASAAEILGLSRQSLYSKLHRYGLGNIAGEPE